MQQTSLVFTQLVTYVTMSINHMDMGTNWTGLIMKIVEDGMGVGINFID